MSKVKFRHSSRNRVHCRGRKSNMTRTKCDGPHSFSLRPCAWTTYTNVKTLILVVFLTQCGH